MKTEKSLWTSISILVGTVIMILALIRGSLQVWLLLGVFAVWGGWVINFLLMPYINRAKKARIRRAQREQRFQDVFADVEAVHETAPQYSAAETAVRSIYMFVENCNKSRKLLFVHFPISKIVNIQVVLISYIYWPLILLSCENRRLFAFPYIAVCFTAGG